MECFHVLCFCRVSGGELFERVINDDFILTEKACVMFMRQICEGVSFMHNQRVLHLDMKVTVHQLPSTFKLNIRFQIR